MYNNYIIIGANCQSEKYHLKRKKTGQPEGQPVKWVILFPKQLQVYEASNSKAI